MVGGSDGTLDIFFLIKREGAGTIDGRSMQPARQFDKRKSPPVVFDQGELGKAFVIAGASGTIEVLHATSRKTVLKREGRKEKRVLDLVLAPPGDGVMAVEEGGRVRLWEFSAPHPETTFHTLFGKVWYEGFEGPSYYTWQSSAGTDAFEPKLSVVPLRFGTIKAASYFLLFAILVAIVGAIYSSEFMDQRLRAFVKPTMEMMASLPSVVLGFVVALVLAPVVETWISAIILVFFVFPASLILSAYLWQFLPQGITLRGRGLPKFLLISGVTVLSFLLSARMGQWFEAVFFYGDFKAWLNRDVGGREPLIFLLGPPVCLCVLAVLRSRLFGHAISERMTGMAR